MIGHPMRMIVLFYIIAATMLLFGLPRAAAQQVQREGNNLRITAVDSSAFPTVAVRILTTATGSAPIADLTRLIVREDGVPIPETTLARTPVGVDLALVLDANADFMQIDGRDEQSRRDKVAASITRYAEQFMNRAGLDRVSVIVPDETGERAGFLAQGETRPDALAAAVAAYQPAPPRATPLQDMMAAAIEQLATGEEGRFRAILLYTDGARLNQQLDYPALVEAAQAANIPLYIAILGTEASDEEIANVTGLYSPTNGLYVHMPEPEAADPLYDIFQRQGDQPELSYISSLRQNGAHEVSVSLGNVRDTAAFELALAAPQVVIEAQQTAVRRAGSAVDTPLPLLQPAVLPLTVRLTWPDGRPRLLSELVFRVDGVVQPLAAELSPDGVGEIPLMWDISERDSGAYRLEVEVADELGFRSAAEPLEIVIDVARPSLPTPTPAPTRVPLPSLNGNVEGSLWPFMLLAAVAGITALVLWSRRKPAFPETAKTDPPMPRIVPASSPPPDDRHVAVLVWSVDDESDDRIELTASDVTFGRETDAVDIVIDDPSVSRLHARIRRNAAGEYWLYDEGSVASTFLNYERLGLAPRQLQHNDVVQIGRVTLRFRLELPRPAGDGSSSGIDGG